MNLLQFICKVENSVLVIAETAEEALQKMSVERFNLVVCDYHLPRMNGLEFFRRIALEGYASIKVLTSVEVTPELIDLAFEIGIHECLRKPLTFSCLESIFSLIETRSKDSRNTVQAVIDPVK